MSDTVPIYATKNECSLLGAKFANYSEQPEGIRVRVMCPKCGSGGAQTLSSCQPKCHVCADGTLMAPAGNAYVVCTWSEAQQYKYAIDT